MATLFEQYLNQVRMEDISTEKVEKKEYIEEEFEEKDIEDKEEEEEDKEEEEGETDEVEDIDVADEDADSEVKDDKNKINIDREDIIISWLKKLNAQFKPYANFKIIIEKDAQGKDETFLSLKPQDAPTERYFYNLTQVKTLNEAVFKEIIELAEKQLSSKAATPTLEEKTNKKEKESLNNIRAIKGWQKKKNTNAILEYKTKDNKKTLEIISQKKKGSFNPKKAIKKYGIVYFNEEIGAYQILEDNINEIEIKNKILNYMEEFI